MSPPKQFQNSRKFAGNPYPERSNVNWKPESSGKCTKCNKFHEENLSAGEESQAAEAKTSEETFSGRNSEANTEEAYSPETENQAVEYPYDCYRLRPEMKTHAEVVLNKLKELQWRRDALERHYTNGVRKIIDDYFFGGSKCTGSHIITGNEERMRAGGIKKNQTYGVRLNCGCFHECERIRQKHISSAFQNPSTSINYPADCKTRCTSRSEAVRST